ncbi:apolipoprotein N-acyltransferase [Meinhardsimonia xiamenensis]|nr:apolipoprotein N-acyltransferase [Meinhardsimonia xiamenensis]
MADIRAGATWRLLPARPRGRMALAALAGALAAAGQAPLGLAWATLVALAALCALQLGARGPREAAWLGWAGGTGHFAAALFWIVEPFLVDAARHGWMAPFALVGLAGGLALFWAGACWLAAWLRPGSGAAPALAWAAALAGAEAVRSYVLTGFPWALIGHVWVGWPAMQLSAWVGPLGLTALTVVTAALAAALAFSRRWSLLPGLGACAALLFVPGLAAERSAEGAGAQAVLPAASAQARPLVRLVQPNAAQHLKWDPEHALRFWQRQIDFTAAPAEGGRRPDLVVWPETAVPWLLERAGAALERIAEAADGVPVVFGIQRTEGGRAYNSLALLDADGSLAAVYDKHHLVPFGEYLPFPGLMARLGLSAFTAQAGYGYTPGPGPVLLAIGGDLGQALPLICYEAIFPHEVLAAPGRADFILQITNDAWFGTLAGPQQHLAQARLRAVETGLPVVRVANTGISAVIDTRGQVIGSLPLGEAGYLDLALPPPERPTIYARAGDAPVILLLTVGLAALAATGRRKPG